MVLEVPVLDLVVDLATEASLRQGAARVLAAVRPSWPEQAVRWKVHTDGITNKLVGGWLEGRREDTVLVRVYGEGTERIIDREQEKANMARLAAVGAGGRLYAAFGNGIAYEFLEGEVLGQGRLWEDAVWRGVATAMATMHRLPLTEEEAAAPCLWPRVRRFVQECRPAAVPGFPAKEELLAEVDRLEEEVATGADTVVFCHNDALLANVVLQAEGRVRFIDLEYGGPNFAAFDIANHFVEFVGCEGRLDYEKWLPGRAWRLAWCGEYLAAREGRPAAMAEVEALQARVEAFMPAAHLLWAVWAVVQAANSSIAFDFADYALQRLREYRRCRGQAGLPARL